nr:helix-turn-helix domain-containing protein [Anaerolineae bacterium]
MPQRIKKFNEYLTVSEAAKYLGVSSSTLRNWDKSGKLNSYRHPLNNYRLYQKRELDKLLEVLENYGSN